MKKYFVLEANNIDSDIFISKPYDTKEEASAFLRTSYRGVLKNTGRKEDKDISDDAYSILCINGDYFYGIIKEVEI